MNESNDSMVLLTFGRVTSSDLPTVQEILLTTRNDSRASNLTQTDTLHSNPRNESCKAIETYRYSIESCSGGLPYGYRTGWVLPRALPSACARVCTTLRTVCISGRRARTNSHFASSRTIHIVSYSTVSRLHSQGAR